ncbi:MAG: SpoIIE family protein phosphatase [Actinocrinis sp.]
MSSQASQPLNVAGHSGRFDQGIEGGAESTDMAEHTANDSDFSNPRPGAAAAPRVPAARQEAFGRPPGWDEQVWAPSGFNASAGFFNWLLPSGEVVCDEQTFRLHGLSPDAEPRFESFLARVPAEDVDELERTLNPLLSNVGDYIFEYRVRWPDGFVHTLETRGRVVAGPDGAPARLMGVIADITDRRAAEQETRDRARTATRIQTVTAGLAAASTLDEVRAAVERALPALGVDALIIADVGSRIEVLLTCGRGAEHPLRVADNGPVRTAMTYESALFYSSSADLCGRFPQVEPIVKEFGLEAWAFLPLAGVPRMRGVCLLGYEQEARFDEAERAVLVLVASAIGQAVYRATVHDTEHSFALALQSGMLPHTLRFGPGVSGAWRYEAATTGIQVGGDWYDSVPLDDGSTILIIGDVEGHNVHAAGTMYRLRTAVRAYAAEKHTVDEILCRAHDFVVEMNDEAEYPIFATCLVARVDPSTRTVTASRAGHIPPLIVPPGRAAHVPSNEVGLPLGVADVGDYPVWDMPYEPGTRLVMCTDGLLESIDNDLDHGLTRTLACLDTVRDVDVETLADVLLTANRPHGLWNDDVALLVAELR